MASWEEFSRIVAEAKASKKLDPVGHEDDDVDNDGDSDSSDSYLKKRRSTIGAAIAADRKRKVEESYDDLDEAKVDEKLPEHERSGARLKRYDNPSGALALGGGQQRARRAEHQARRGKPKRWWDDDGDGIGYEKGEVKKESVEQIGELFVIKKSPKEDKERKAAELVRLMRATSDPLSDVAPRRKKVKTNEESEQIDEIAPLVAGGLALGGALAAGSAIKRAQDAAKSGVNAANKGQNIKNPGTGIAGAAYGMQKRNNALNDAMKQLRQSYEPEGEMVEEDKEYRREMRKAAARERAEERREKGGKAAKSPGREGPSAGKTYADYQEISIKAHDKITRKNKNPIGLVTKEENELDEGMTMKDFKKQRSRQKQKDKRESEKTSPLRGRTGIHDDKASPERAARHRANVDPDYDHDDEEDMYPGGKLKNPKKIRKAKAIGELTKEEYIEEKALSRAQQRFMGMVYAAKKGETPASPEVAKAASGMSKKAARDFAKTKHEGLPEKKEETKEEVSLIDRILAEASDAQFMAAKARREDREKKQQTRLKQAKVSVAANKALENEKSSDTPKKEKSKEEQTGKGTATERAARTSAAGRVSAARIARETEREKESARTERQRERMSYTEKRREEKAKQKEEEEKSREERNAAKEAARAKQNEAKAKQKELEQKEKEKKSELKAKEDARKHRRSELRRDIKSAWSEPIKVAGDKKDTEAVAAGVRNVGSLIGSVAKTGLAVGKYAYRKSKENRSEKKSDDSTSSQKVQSVSVKDVTSKSEDQKSLSGTPERKKMSGAPERKKLVPSAKRLPPAGETGKLRRGTGMSLGQRARRNPALKSALIKSRMEEYSNWREEFIFEVDDLSVQNEKEKIIDVSKKKNKIEINPNMSEGCGCDEKEKEIKPQKDMRDLPTKVNLLKTKARSMGVRNPIMMVASEGAAWTKKEGKSEAGGLNEKGRKSYERENPGSDLKAPSKKVGNPRRASFCSRMKGMKEKLTSAKTANDPDSRINKSLRAWNC